MIRDVEPKFRNVFAASIPLRMGIEMSVTMTSGFILMAAWTRAFPSPTYATILQVA